MNKENGNKDKDLPLQGHTAEKSAKDYHRYTAPKRKAKKKEASDKQKLFVKHYLATFSEAKAAELTGYRPQHGRELMNNPLVREAINTGINELFKKNNIEEGEIIKQLSKIAFEQSPHEKNIRVADQIAALKLLGQNINMFKEIDEKQEIQPPRITIIVDKDRTEELLDATKINAETKHLDS
jgi:phage terminase small subunit